jgi:DinB superfamily
MNVTIATKSACLKADFKFYRFRIEAGAESQHWPMGASMNKLGMVTAIWMMCISSAWPQTTNGEHPSSSRVFDELVTNSEGEIVPAAEAMPEDKFTFAPTEGEFKGVRTFAEEVKHLSAANYQLAARILGEKPPHDERNESAPDSIRTKEQIIEYLKGSFAYLHKAVGTINERNLVDPIPGIKGTWQRTRLGSAVDALAHSYDHYGQMVEYLRMNGIVPPASR